MPSTAPDSPLYSKFSAELTLPIAPGDAFGVCQRAAEATKAMHIQESDADRLLVKHIPGMGKNCKIEVLLADAGGSSTNVTLKGWLWGLGKSQVVKPVEQLRDAIDAQATSAS